MVSGPCTLPGPRDRGGRDRPAAEGAGPASSSARAKVEELGTAHRSRDIELVLIDGPVPRPAEKPSSGTGRFEASRPDLAHPRDLPRPGTDARRGPSGGDGRAELPAHRPRHAPGPTSNASAAASASVRGPGENPDRGGPAGIDTQLLRLKAPARQGGEDPDASTVQPGPRCLTRSFFALRGRTPNARQARNRSFSTERPALKSMAKDIAIRTPRPPIARPPLAGVAWRGDIGPETVGVHFRTADPSSFPPRATRGSGSRRLPIVHLARDISAPRDVSRPTTVIETHAMCSDGRGTPVFEVSGTRRTFSSRRPSARTEQAGPPRAGALSVSHDVARVRPPLEAIRGALIGARFRDESSPSTWRRSAAGALALRTGGCCGGPNADGEGRN